MGPRMDSVRLTDTRLWPSCIGFRNFAVNEVHVGSIPIGHPREHFRWQVPLGRKLDCLSSRCGFDSRCHRFQSSRIRLLARSAASQAAGRRSKLLCGTWSATKLANQNGVVDSDGRIVWFSSRSPRVRFPLTSLRSITQYGSHPAG